MSAERTALALRRAMREDAAGIAEVHVRSWRASYAAILPGAFLSGLSVEQRTGSWAARLGEEEGAAGEIQHASFVVTDPQGRICGFCSAGPNRSHPREFAGEVYAIYLLPESTRRGGGRALFEAARGWLRARGLEPVVVWVLAENLGAGHFYQRLGGAEIARRPIRIGAMSYPEIGYGFGPARPQASR